MSYRSQQEKMSGWRNDGTRLINPRKFSYLTLLMRCSETTILLRTIPIPFGDSSLSSRQSSASDSPTNREVHAPAAGRALLN
ncbi:hypothetical protein DPMN_190862 [Dreissena polymorpha]|uniref:Uncharacterized protein n=1 Tax=Dreissena polymorpha TaxID=45954 RepID=A0A9D3XYZ6_DREPO|nr:hypothetical protein DPMN_190862 [Dreissena polymorpha]